MSSDPGKPGSQWWNQPQEPKGNQPQDQEDQDPQGPEETQRFSTGQRDQGYQGGQGFQGPEETQRFSTGQAAQGNQGPSRDQGYQQGQGYGQGQGYQQGQGYRGNEDYQDSQKTQAYSTNQGYQRPQETQRPPAYQEPQDFQRGRTTQGFPGSEEPQGFPAGQGYPPPQDFPAAQGYQGPPARARRRRRRRWPWITVIVILVVLVVGDRAANAYTEDQMASQFQSSLELSGKPHVTIQGFPFLTQLAARDFKTVNINASNETAGPGGQLEIASLTATLHGMHIHGLNSATIDNFNASALITFTALGKAGGIPQGITLTADGPNKIKANVSIGPLSDTAVAQVTQTGAGKINVKIIDAGGIPTDLLGSLANFTVSIPKLPAGVALQSVSVTQQGIRITAGGHNTTLSQ